ncbi:TPA: hypothetical protein ACGUIF_001208 [Serratia liquefaciens]
MLFDSYGRGETYGKDKHEFIWDVALSPAIPDFLEIVGEHTIEFLDTSVSKGICRITVPSDDSVVSIRTKKSVKTDLFSEIGFYVFSMTSQVSQQTQNIYIGDENGGAGMYRKSTTVPEHFAKVFPSGDERQLDYVWSLNDGNYATKPKNLGITVRPEDKAVYFTQGDHMNGDPGIWYDRGNWQDGLYRPSLQLSTSSTQTQQRSVSFSKILFRLCYW